MNIKLGSLIAWSSTQTTPPQTPHLKKGKLGITRSMHSYIMAASPTFLTLMWCGPPNECACVCLWGPTEVGPLQNKGKWKKVLNGWGTEQKIGMHPQSLDSRGVIKRLKSKQETCAPQWFCILGYQAHFTAYPTTQYKATVPHLISHSAKLTNTIAQPQFTGFDGH